MPDEEELAACALLYSCMSVQHLKKECRERGLAENRLVSGRRVPQFKFGKLTKFRRMLEASDVLIERRRAPKPTCPTYFRHTSDISLAPVSAQSPICSKASLNGGETQSPRVRHTSDIPPTYPGPHCRLKARFTQRPHSRLKAPFSAQGPELR